MPPKATKIKNGDIYGRLTVIDANCGYIGTRRLASLVRCECGAEKLVMNQNLTNGNTLSCGCFNHEQASKRMRAQREPFKHTITTPRLYSIWRKMKSRCTNKNDKQARYYTLKGICVCKEWAESYEAFEMWSLAHGYNDKLSIDRIDNSRGYSPQNCRWADAYIQNNNSSNCHYVTIEGRTQSLAQWCREFNMPYGVVRRRINGLKWDEVKALTTPLLRVRGGK